MIRFNKKVNWDITTGDSDIPLVHVDRVMVVDNGIDLIFEIWSDYQDLLLNRQPSYKQSVFDTIVVEVITKFNTELGFSKAACSEIDTSFRYNTSIAVIRFLIKPRFGVLYNESDPYYRWSIKGENL